MAIVFRLRWKEAGLLAITLSSSLSMLPSRSRRSLKVAMRSLSSLRRAMRCSRLIEKRVLGMAMASKISSSELELMPPPRGLSVLLAKEKRLWRGASPFRARSASDGVPSPLTDSSTAVSPPREGTGERRPDEASEIRLDSRRSMFRTRLALPLSHACTRALRSCPMASYWTMSRGPRSEMSSASSMLVADSSRSTCILACKLRMTDDSALSF